MLRVLNFSGMGEFLKEGGSIVAKVGGDTVKSLGLALPSALPRLGLEAAQETIKSVGLSVPIFGQIVSSVVGAGMSLGTTVCALNKVLNKLEPAAVEVVKAAMESSAENTCSGSPAAAAARN